MNVPATAEKGKAVRKLLGGKLKRAEHERMVYRVKPDDGTSVEDILKPEYWAHVGKQLRPFDLIEIVFVDGSRYLDLVVIDAGPLWAKVAVKADIDLTSQKKEAAAAREHAEENAPYKAEYKGGAKWCVIRTSDGEMVEKGLSSKDEAVKWIENYQKVLAA